MKSLLVVCLFAAIVAVVYSLPKPDEKYTTKFDSINLDNILGNERLVRNYVDCLLSKGPCTPDGAELKKVVPDALQNKCAKCNDKQKDGAERVIKELSEKYEKYWEMLRKEFDPEGIYKKNYEHLAKEKNIKV